MGKLDDDVFGFQPKQITILSGQTVRWTNVSPSFIIPHTATHEVEEDGKAVGVADDQQEPLEFDSGAVAANGSFVRTFTLPPGVPFTLFGYHCDPHQGLGMVGKILVIAPPQQ